MALPALNSTVTPRETQLEDRNKGVSTRPSESSGNFWNPFWLRRLTLGACACLFGASAIAILTLYGISVKFQGVASYTRSNEAEYFWKYLPTTVLVILLALWTQVDFFTRLLQPWYNLRRGATADRTLFLDLISPTLPQYWLSSFKHRDWPAALTVTGCVFLQTAKILSTGLLALEPTDTTVKGMVLSNKAQFEFSHVPARDGRGGNYSTAGAIYHGIHSVNLTYPDWTTPDFAFEPLEPILSEVKSELIEYSGQTVGFYPQLSCEPAVLKEWVWVRNAPVINATFEAKPCTVLETMVLAEQTPTIIGATPKTPHSVYYTGDTRSLSCPDGPWYLVTDFALIYGEAGTEATFSYSAAMCRPSYSTRNIQVSLDHSLRLKDTQVQPSNASNITSQLDLATLFDAVMSASSSGMFTTSSAEDAPPFLKLATLPLYQGVSNVQEPYLQWLMDTQTMIPQVEGTFKGIAVQLAAQDLMRSNSERANGSILCSTDRLQVKEVPAIVMTVCLTLGSLIALSMFYMRPWNVVPREPNSVLGIAAILNSSEDVKALLTDPLPVDKKKIPREETIASVSKGAIHTYTVLVPGKSEADCQPDVPKHSSKKIAWWRPLPLQPWVRAGALLLILATICGLEVLQQMSDQHHGFAGVDLSKRESARYAATFIPTLILVGIAALASSLNFNITLLSPYRAMRDRPCVPERCIQSNDVGRWPLFQAFHSIRRRHFAAFATSFASIIAGFLTIAVSGLYTLESVDKSTGISLSRSDGFRTAWYGNIYSDGNAASVLGFMSWQNLSYPIWTYDDLAFPHIAINGNATSSLELGRSVSATIPAQRAVLNCTLADPEKTVIRHNITHLDTKDFLMESEMLNTCAGNGSKTAYYIENIPSLFPQGFGGALNQLEALTGGTPIAIPYSNTNDQLRQEPGCASLSFYFGSFGPAPTYQPADVTAFTCTQHVQEVSTRVSFLLPGLEIDTANPPVPDEPTARYLVNDDDDDGAAANASNIVFNYPVAFPIHSAFLPTTNGSTFSVPGLDEFFTAVVHGRDGIPPPELVGRANAPRLVDATKKLYGRYMAQVMSLKMREGLNVSDGAPLPQIRGVARAEGLRAAQNAGPKVALQVLLAAMAVCGAAAWALMRTAELLPHNPCSAAGVAALLAGGGCVVRGNDDDAGSSDRGAGGRRGRRGGSSVAEDRSRTPVPGRQGTRRAPGGGCSDRVREGLASDGGLGLDRVRRRERDDGEVRFEDVAQSVDVADSSDAGTLPVDAVLEASDTHADEAEANTQSRDGWLERGGIFPEGVEWMDDEEIVRRGILDGKLFSLSRWPGGRFGIDVVEADSQISEER